MAERRPTIQTTRHRWRAALAAATVALASVGAVFGTPVPAASMPTSPLAGWSAVKLALPTSASALDPATGQVLAAVAPSVPGLGNHLVEVDPTTGALGRSVLVPSQPSTVAVADDGSRAYVGSAATPTITEVDLTTFTVVRTIDLGVHPTFGWWRALDLAVQPGHPEVVAAALGTDSTRGRAVAIYRSGIRQPTSAPSDAVDLAWSADPAILHGVGMGVVSTFTVGPAGVTVTATAYTGGSTYDLAVLDDQIIGTDGKVVSLPGLTPAGSFSSRGATAADADSGRVAFLSSTTLAIHAIGSRALLGTLTVPAVSPVSKLGAGDVLLDAGDALVATGSEGIVLIGPGVTGAGFTAPTAPERRVQAWSTRTVPLRLAAIVSAPDGSRLYGVARQSAPTNAGELVEIDPATGAITRTVAVGGDPGELEISADGSSLLVGHWTADHLTEVDRSTLTVRRTVPIPATAIATDIAAVPGTSDRFAVALAAYSDVATTADAVVIVDHGTILPGIHQMRNDAFHLAFGPSGDRLYGFGTGTAMVTYELGIDGIEQATYHPGVLEGSSSSQTVASADGLIYDASGTVIDPERAVPVARLATWNWVPVPVPDQDRVVLVHSNRLLEFDTRTWAVVSDQAVPDDQPNGAALAGSTLAIAGLQQLTLVEVGPDPRPVPAVSSLDPSTVTTAGGPVTVHGSGFTWSTAVQVDGRSVPFTLVDDETIQLTVPARQAGAVTVTVIHPAGRSTGGPLLTYVAPQPQVEVLQPDGGPAVGGNVVRITGSGFSFATSVAFAGVPAAAFTVVSDTAIDATAPAGTSPTAAVSVTTAGGTNPQTAASTYRYTADPPTVTSLSPARGSRDGGYTIEVRGSALGGATSVEFGPGYPSQDVDVLADDLILAEAPYHPEGPVEVRVTTPNGTSSATGDEATFEYTPPPPFVQSMWPTSGPSTGGNRVQLYGEGFRHATRVDVDGIPSPSIEVRSDYELWFTMPPHDPGTVTVTVTSPTGTSPSYGWPTYTYVLERPPIANAGPDQKVAKGAAFTLDGGASTDPDGRPLTYQWVQLSGPVAVINDPTQKYASVQPVGQDGRLVFQLTVTDSAGLTHTDTVQVTVGNPK